MGKAVILKNYDPDPNFYQIQLIKNCDLVKIQEKAITNKINKLLDVQFDLEIELTTLQGEVATAEANLNIAIANYRAGSISKEELKTYISALTTTRTNYQKLSRRVDTTNLELESLRLRQTALNSIINHAEAGEILNVFCTDYSPGLLPGQLVGTIEINGEPRTILVHPDVDYGAERDGALAPILAMATPQCIYNYALLPGWQKWLPTFRIGTISEINYTVFYHQINPYEYNLYLLRADTATVVLDTAYSQAQNLNINQARNIPHCQFDYMNTIYNRPSGAFIISWLRSLDFDDVWIYEHFTIPYVPVFANLAETGNNGGHIPFYAGDRVVVGFTSQEFSKPRIIGFPSDPKQVHIRLKLTWRNDNHTYNPYQTGEELIPPNLISNMCVQESYFMGIPHPWVLYDTTISYNQRTGYWEITFNEEYLDREVCFAGVYFNVGSYLWVFQQINIVPIMYHISFDRAIIA